MRLPVAMSSGMSTLASSGDAVPSDCTRDTDQRSRPMAPTSTGVPSADTMSSDRHTRDP